MTEKKRPVGRPRTTLNDLPNDWEQRMLDVGEQGGSMLEARHALGIAMSAWETLLEDYEEFREAERMRNELCEIWWESAGRKLVDGRFSKGSAATWIFNMKNRFGWRDKIETDHTSSDGSMTPAPTVIEIVAPDNEDEEKTEH